MRASVVLRIMSVAALIAVVAVGYGLSRTAPGGDRAEAAARLTLSQSEQAAILAQHNDWRARYNVPPVVWDAGLANIAEGWANLQAGGTVSGHRPDNQYGENIWEGSAGGYPLSQATDDWGNEVNDYNAQTNTCNDGAVCGHYTQLVWKTTVRIGCGKATGNGTDYIVCNYDPPGNVDGVSPFAP